MAGLSEDLDGQKKPDGTVPCPSIYHVHVHMRGKDMYVCMYVCMYVITRILTTNRQSDQEPGRLREPFILNRPLRSRAYEFDLDGEKNQLGGMRVFGAKKPRICLFFFNFAQTHVVALQERGDELVDFKVGEVLA